MLSSPIPTISAHLSPPPNSMPPDLLTRRVTRTETLGPGLIPVRPPPFFVVARTTAFPHEGRKRPLEEDEEATGSRKRHCPSQELCMFCGRPAEEPKKKKENRDPSGSVSAPSASKSTPLPSPAPATTPQAAAPTSNPPPPLCKMGRKKPVLNKEIYRPVRRPQPFRRMPTAVNKQRIDMRNNLRDIFLGTKEPPAKVRYARDAMPRPRRGTPPSNPEHRGELNQPAPKGFYNYTVPPLAAAAAGLPERLPASAFLGSGPRAWRRDTEHLEVPEVEPCLEGEVFPEFPTLTIRHVESGVGVPVYISTFASWALKSRARKLWDRLRQRAEKEKEREKKRGRRPKPVARRPDGRPSMVLEFPIVPSKLRMELARGYLEGGDEEDMMEVDDATPSEAD